MGFFSNMHWFRCKLRKLHQDVRLLRDTIPKYMRRIEVAMATFNERLAASKEAIAEFRAASDAQINKVFGEVQALKDHVAQGGVVTEETLAGLENEILKLADTKELLTKVDDLNDDASTEPTEPTNGEDIQDDEFTTG